MLLRCLCWSFLAGVWSGSAAAIDEASLPARFLSELVPFVQQFPKESFSGVGGLKIAYRVIKQPGAHAGIVLIHGYSESTLKYAELIYDFTQAGYNVYAMDLRGMGESARMLGNPQIGHVAQFDDYASDVATFIEQVARPQEAGELFLFAHSTGALAAVMALAKGPVPVRAVVLSSPMFGLNTGPFPSWFVYALTWFNVKRGAGGSYILGAGDYQASEDDPAKSHVTHSVVRATQTSQLYRNMPALRVWGQSNSWVLSSLIATAAVQDLAPALTLPLLILQAEDELVVRRDAESAFCAQAPHCRLLEIKGARHEIVQELDAVRKPVVSAILEFFRSHEAVAAKAGPGDAGRR